MKRSTDRILTTHVGSLIRPPDLREMIRARESGTPYDHGALAARVRSAVAEAVRKQVECGIDIVSDGEQGKLGFNTYTHQRLGGFEPRALRPGEPPRQRRRDWDEFPEFYDEYWQTQTVPAPPLVCTGPVTYKREAVETDIRNFKEALQAVRVEEAFIPAIAPFYQGENRFYPTEHAFLSAVADALHEEYQAIVEAGFILQIDDPGLPTQWDAQIPAISVAEYRKRAAQRVELVNHALRGIPEERVRYHICWGSWHGPHVTDLPLKDVVDLLLRVRAQAYSVEAANPRHEHEYHVWEDVKLPEGKILIPGVIAHTTNTVEHPELVQERILRYAKLVGRENVIAGADCGFAQGAFTERAHPTIVWAKLKSLAEGARLASEQLWRR
jgi:5-methyltetrahydropteroyltriglutamate--homocysteine methyltransferase